MTESETTRPSPLQSGAAWVFLASSWLFAAGVAMQVYLAGAGILVDPSYFGWHITFAHLLEALFLILLIAGLVGRVGRNAFGWLGLLFLLFGMQYAFVHGFAGPARALHAVNALVLLLVALHLARRQWRLMRGLPANADGAGGDRMRRAAVISLLVIIPVVVLTASLSPTAPTTAQSEADVSTGPGADSASAATEAASASGGGEIFASRCSGCHGAEGQGGYGPKLAGELRSADRVVEQVLEGGGGMPSFANQLSDEQIAQVAYFVGNSWGNHLGTVDREFVSEHR